MLMIRRCTVVYHLISYGGEKRMREEEEWEEGEEEEWEEEEW